MQDWYPVCYKASRIKRDDGESDWCVDSGASVVLCDANDTSTCLHIYTDLPKVPVHTSAGIV